MGQRLGGLRLDIWRPAALVVATLVVLQLSAPRPSRAQGFQESIAMSGLTNPTAIEFAADGRVFVAEKSGIIKVFDSLSDTTPTIFADLRTNVYNFWDRGLLGLALHPNFPTQPYVYVLYTHDAEIGGTAPRWGTPGATSDPCPNPPGATGDGCVASGRLSRLEAAGNVMTGSEQVLIEDWFQQYPSHSIGNLAFGSDGALYVSAGDGASFNFVDYGQVGNPLNPGGDPPVGVGGVQTPPTAEGGALRSQDLRTAGDPVTLDGTILRVHPDTGEGMPDNPFAGSPDPNTRRIISYGLRNPFRFAPRPGTNEVWVGDVGWNDWEEINRIVDPADASAENFGWPCYEGGAPQAGYDAADLNICEQLYAMPGAVTGPFFAYHQSSQVVPGDTGPTGGSISGIAFYNGGSYPAAYVGALFFTDYSRNGIWVMFPGAGGLPDPATRATFATATNPVELQIGPGGDLFYVDFLGGTIRRIQYLNTNEPPTANAGPDQTATPGQQVTLNGTGSSDPNGNPLTYLWTQTGGPAVTLSSSTVAQPTFTAPSVSSSTTLAFQLVVNDGQSSSLPDTVLVIVTAPNLDLTDMGGIIARVPNPTGGGNPNLEVIRDGDKPPVGNQDSSRQYDSFDGANQAAEDWIGYDYGSTLHAFGRVVFQEGRHFGDGGWFETLTVQVRQSGTWANVPGLLTITPAYPGTNNGVTYETYTLTFNPVAGDAIRIYGSPGGTNDYISVGELEVFAPAAGGNTPPSATITAPAPGTTWQVGQVFAFSGGATDTQDGSLAPAALSWSLILHHCSSESSCHEHPVQDFPGIASGSFTAPDHEYPSYLELRLTATDSGGLTNTTSVQLDPLVTGLTFESSPLGLQLVFGSDSATAPFNRTVIVGSNSSISAPSPQTLGGTTYAFASWSDGGAQSHNITAGASPTTYVATYGAFPTIFGTATGYPTGSETHGVATGDFDADGRLDLVAANHGTSNVSVLRGNGNGTFQAAVNYAVGLGPKSVHVGDFNNDGLRDLVSANQEGDSVSVLLGNGNGTFQTAVDYPICSRGHEAAIGDLNGDGRQDLAVACWNGSVVSVLLGNGNGTFQVAINYPAGSGPHSIVAGDFHGDGPIDLAVANHSDNNVTVLRGNGNGTFQAPVGYAVGLGPHSLRTADLNLDGRLDLAVVDDGSHDARVLLNNGNGTFGSATSYATGSVPKGIGLGDVNGDGVPDLVATNTAGSYPVCCQPGGDTVSVLLGNGNGTFAAQTIYTVGLTPFAVAIGDLNGDGLRDLATANWHSNDVTVLLNQIPPGATTTTTLAATTTTTTATTTTTLAATTTTTITTTTTTTSTTLAGGGLPAPWTSGDIGATAIPGSASFASGTFTVNGSGADIWGSADAFHFVHQPWSGDGRITARVTSVQDTSPWAKAGVMMRATLAAESAHAMVVLTPGFGWAFQSRSSTGSGSVHTAGGSATAPTWVRLTRTGSTLTAEVSSDGVTWEPGGSTSISLGATIYVGLAVTAHNNSALTTATFDNVSVTTAAPPTTTTTIATTTTTVAPTTTTTVTTTTTSTTLSSGGLPAPWTSGDIGATGIAGSASYAGGTFTVNGSGADIWGSADAFHFVRQPWSGDGRITARVTGVQDTSPWAKAGVMMRATLAANSAHAMVVLTPGFGWAFQSRASTGSGSVHTAGGAATAPTWVRLTRTGNTITAEVSSNGVTWAPGGSTSIPLGASISVGLAVTAHSNSAVTTATFDNVSVQ